MTKLSYDEFASLCSKLSKLVKIDADGAVTKGYARILADDLAKSYVPYRSSSPSDMFNAALADKEAMNFTLKMSATVSCGVDDILIGCINMQRGVPVSIHDPENLAEKIRPDVEATLYQLRHGKLPEVLEDV